jgi:hypothetical protein
MIAPSRGHYNHHSTRNVSARINSVETTVNPHTAGAALIASF